MAHSARPSKRPHDAYLAPIPVYVILASFAALKGAAAALSAQLAAFPKVSAMKPQFALQFRHASAKVFIVFRHGRGLVDALHQRAQ